MGRDSKTFSQERHIDSQNAYKKTLITNHQGNANQNHNVILPHTCSNGCYKKDNKQQVFAGMRREGYICALLVGLYLGTV